MKHKNINLYYIVLGVQNNFGNRKRDDEIRFFVQRQRIIVCYQYKLS